MNDRIFNWVSLALIGLMCLPLESHADEYGQVSDMGEVLTSEDLEPVGPPTEGIEKLFHGGIKAGGINLKYGGFLSVDYDDNVNLDDKNPREEVVTRFGPKFKVTYGGDQIESDLLRHVPGETFWAVEYKPVFNIYGGETDDHVDHYVHGVLNFASGKTQYSWRSIFQRFEAGDIRAGERTARFDWKNDMVLTREVGAYTTVGATLGHRWESFEDSQFIDSQEVSGSVYVDHDVTDKITWGGSLGGGYLDADTNQQLFGDVRLRLSYRPTAKLFFSSSFGADIRDNDDEVRPVNFVWDMRGTWTPYDSTSIVLLGYQHVTNSTITRDSDYLATGVKMFFTQGMFDDRLLFKVTPGYEHSEYFGVSDGVIDDRQDDYYFVETGFTYLLTDWASLEVYYKHRGNISNNSSYEFENNRVGFMLGITY